MTFSASEAAFEGFRVVRRHPGALVFWGLAYLVYFSVAFGLFGSSVATIMATSEALEASGDPSVAQLEALGESFGWLFLLAVPLGLVLGAVVNTAVARAVLRPGERRYGYLRLGIDELRVLAVTLVLSLILGAVAIVAFFMVAVVGATAQAVGQPALWLVAVGLGAAAVGVLIWLSARFSLAVPIVVAERRMAVFDSFNLTRGRVWPLLGMAIIAGMMTLLISLLSGIVAQPIALAVGSMEDLAAYDGRSTLEILRAAWPAVAVWCGLNAVFSAMQLPVMNAPFSAAFSDIRGLPRE